MKNKQTGCSIPTRGCAKVINILFPAVADRKSWKTWRVWTCLTVKWQTWTTTERVCSSCCPSSPTWTVTTWRTGKRPTRTERSTETESTTMRTKVRSRASYWKSLHLRVHGGKPCLCCRRRGGGGWGRRRGGLWWGRGRWGRRRGGGRRRGRWWGQRRRRGNNCSGWTFWLKIESFLIYACALKEEDFGQDGEVDEEDEDEDEDDDGMYPSRIRPYKRLFTTKNKSEKIFKSLYSVNVDNCCMVNDLQLSRAVTNN